MWPQDAPDASILLRSLWPLPSVVGLAPKVSVNDNTRLLAHVSVIREDGAVLFSTLAQRSWSFGDDIDEAQRYAARCERWLERMPTPDFDPEVFARREVDGEDLRRIIDNMLRPELLHGSPFDLEAVT